MKRAITVGAVSVAVLLPATVVATASSGGGSATRKAELAACLSRHGVSVDTRSISKAYLRAHIVDPGMLAALRACGHVPGA